MKIPHSIALGAFACVLSACTKPCEDQGKLIEVAQESVLEHLKAPATAEFTDATVKPSADGQGQLVQGSVDAENSFGAKVRDKWSVNVKCKDGNPFAAIGFMGANTWGPEWEAVADSIMQTMELDTL